MKKAGRRLQAKLTAHLLQERNCFNFQVVYARMGRTVQTKKDKNWVLDIL